MESTANAERTLPMFVQIGDLRNKLKFVVPSPVNPIKK